MPDLINRIRRELDTGIRGLARLGARLLPGVGSRVGASGAPETTAGEAGKPIAGASVDKPAARRPSQARRGATPRGKLAPRGQTQAKVLAALGAAPGSSAADVAKASGIPTNVAAATISRLVKQSRVRRLEGGGYSLVEAATGDSPDVAPVASAKADQPLSE